MRSRSLSTCRAVCPRYDSPVIVLPPPPPLGVGRGRWQVRQDMDHGIGHALGLLEYGKAEALVVSELGRLGRSVVGLSGLLGNVSYPEPSNCVRIVYRKMIMSAACPCGVADAGGKRAHLITRTASPHTGMLKT